VSTNGRDPVVTLPVDLGELVTLDGMLPVTVPVPATIYVVTDPASPDDDSELTVIRVNRDGYIQIGGRSQGVAAE
jgi:hypothetical protein